MQKSLDLSKIRYHLKNAGFSEIKSAKGRPSVLIVDGVRVAVKQANLSNNLWKFNFHVHNELNESDLDAYLLLLNGVPGCGAMALYLILPAPIGVKGIWISFSSLMRKYRDNIEAWKLLKDLIESRQSAA
jgi:carboxypeptidase C (cathepsin A)